jgi:hypothetical protein
LEVEAVSNPAQTDELPPLPDIDDVEPYGPADDTCFEELRAVLERHGALNRFGITLLHQHFEISEEEVLVESIDKANRILMSAPEPSESAGVSVETSWRLGSKKVQKKCETRCRKERSNEGEQYHLKQHYTVS